MKKICTLFTVLLFALLLYTAVSAAEESASPRHIPRVVSIVFDDSGSMYEETDRWAYTSYAMQAFTAMMGDGDVLYITYLNDPRETVRMEFAKLGKTDKQKIINDFSNTMFGGSTPDKLAVGAAQLEKEYERCGDGAKYYLVAMADGELDRGEFSSSLPQAASDVKMKLGNADFEAIYFSMASKQTISGVECYYATTGEEIVSRLKEVSADIMGRTDITDSCTVSGGKLSFELKYPALSVTLFIQKNDTVFENVTIPIQKDGKDAFYEADTYYVNCPGKIVKNPNKTQYNEKIPKTLPHGFVTLITDQSSFVAKGKYEIDISQYNLSKNDIVVLAEPAVRVGCKYYPGDSEEPRDFSEIKDLLRIGESVTVKCGLYELNPDGTLGDEVPSDVLSPDYQLYINDAEVTKKIQGKKNAYRITMSEEYAEKELRIKAVLKNYQPFVLKEEFGKLSVKPIVDTSKNFKSEITITKPDFQKLMSGKISVEFPLMSVDGGIMKDTEIRVAGYDGLKSGKCSDCASVKGNSIVYTLLPRDKKIKFSSLPTNFTVSLHDSFADTTLMQVKVKIIQPEYKFNTQNGLDGKKLSTELLENNTSKITFTLVADYDGDGKYTALDEYDLKNSVTDFKLEKGGFSGDDKKDGAEISFVPVYKGGEKDEFFSTGHKVYAHAKIDGNTVTSEKLEFTVNKPEYKLEVQNGIASSLTLNTLKTNTEKITFVMTADYDGDGKFEKLSEKDRDAYKELEVYTGKLPGKIQTEYDDGEPSGVSFTPFYDDQKDKKIQLISLADTQHKITAKSEKFGLSAEIELSVSSVAYRLDVKNEITESLSPEALKANTQRIVFTVLADYEGGGEFKPLADWDSAIYDGIKINSDGLCGKTQTEYDADGKAVGISFTPFYDEKNDKIPLGDLVGRTYTVKASADKQGISNSASVTVGNITYKISVVNEIDAPFTLDTVKSNTKKIAFTILADYEGDGKFTSLAKWDSAVYDRLMCDTGKLPGEFITEYGSDKTPVGKSFIPVYDENNNNGLAFTEVAGKKHTVKGYIDGTDISASASVEVLAPVYDIKVLKDGITFIDVKLLKNKEGIEFEISRNDRVLNAPELEGLKPYDIVLSSNSDSVSINAVAVPKDDGTAYLSCQPTYNGWKLISPVLWNWRSLYKVTDGDVQLTLTVANASATADFHIDTDPFYFTVFLIVLAVIAFIAWVIFCFMTRMRFPSGTFYRVTFDPDPMGRGWCVSTVERKKANKGRFGMFFRSKFLLPFAHQKKTLSLLDSTNKASFETQRGDSMFEFVSLPHWKTKGGFMYNTGILDGGKILGILDEDPEVFFTNSEIHGTPMIKQDDFEIIFKMDFGTFLCESSDSPQQKTIIFFLSNRMERELRGN
ncbi:MAG: hypothetical protein E7588_04345 [Ruminococcaceae bacterium]|nr:hypothetical protein [Oscillospiraceae bacterium]